MGVSIKVGIAGYGISAKVFHVPFITTIDGFELVAVLERTKSESREKFPHVKIVRSIDELVKDPQIDLVVVTTPNDTHFEYASKALLAGKHVVLEKPFTNTVDEARKLIDIAHRTNRIFSVYQNRRYVSDFLTIKELIAGNTLGEIHEYTANYDRYRSEARPNAWREAPKAGSGILYDLGPHLIDQALVLFGKPKYITADIRSQRSFAQVDDYFNIWLDFGFTKAVLHSGMLIRESGPRYMVHGTKGSYVKSGEDPQEAKLREGHLPLGEDWGKEPEEFNGLLHTEINGDVVRTSVPTHKGDFGGYYRNVYEAIVNHAPVHEKPEHGYNTIRIIELAFESNRLRKTMEVSGLL